MHSPESHLCLFVDWPTVHIGVNHVGLRVYLSRHSQSIKACVIHIQPSSSKYYIKTFCPVFSLYKQSAITDTVTAAEPVVSHLHPVSSIQHTPDSSRSHVMVMFSQISVLTITSLRVITSSLFFFCSVEGVQQLQ